MIQNVFMHLFYKLNHCAMLYRKKRPKLLELYIHLENYLITTTATGIKITNDCIIHGMRLVQISVQTESLE